MWVDYWVFIAIAAVWLASLFAVYFYMKAQAELARPLLTPSDELLRELADLRHLKAQFDNPPQAHQHIWPREPDVRKMGWLRYRCQYAGCPMIDWRPA